MIAFKTDESPSHHTNTHCRQVTMTHCLRPCPRGTSPRPSVPRRGYWKPWHSANSWQRPWRIVRKVISGDAGSACGRLGATARYSHHIFGLQDMCQGRYYVGAPGLTTRNKDATRGSWRVLGIIPSGAESFRRCLNMPKHHKTSTPKTIKMTRLLRPSTHQRDLGVRFPVQ